MSLPFDEVLWLAAVAHCVNAVATVVGPAGWGRPATRAGWWTLPLAFAVCFGGSLAADVVLGRVPGAVSDPTTVGMFAAACLLVAVMPDGAHWLAGRIPMVLLDVLDAYGTIHARLLRGAAVGGPVAVLAGTLSGFGGGFVRRLWHHDLVTAVAGSGIAASKALVVATAHHSGLVDHDLLHTVGLAFFVGHALYSLLLGADAPAAAPARRGRRSRSRPKDMRPPAHILRRLGKATKVE